MVMLLPSTFLGLGFQSGRGQYLSGFYGTLRECAEAQVKSGKSCREEKEHIDSLRWCAYLVKCPVLYCRVVLPKECTTHTERTSLLERKTSSTGILP